MKHPANPLITGDDPSHLWVLREADGTFRMWYQANVKNAEERRASYVYSVSVAYAESKDGMHWEKPALDLFPDAEQYNLPRNTVDPSCSTRRSANPARRRSSSCPEKDRHGFRYVMLYLMTHRPAQRHPPHRLAGRHPLGRRRATRASRSFPSDTHNTIHYDAARDEYVMFCRSKHIYHAAGQTKEPLSSGESRRGMSRMSSKELWTEWNVRPQTILMPDERDAELGYNYFMAMPVHQHAGHLVGPARAVPVE